MSKIRQIAFVAILVLCLGGIVHAQGESALKSPDLAEFQRPKAQVWQALIESLAIENVHPKVMDLQSGFLAFETDAEWTAAWGGVNRVVSALTTKSVKGYSTWQAITVSGNVFCKEIEGGGTQVRVTFRFAGFNGYARTWQPLQSNGALERSVLDGIGSVLHAPVNAGSIRETPCSKLPAGDPIVGTNGFLQFSLHRKPDESVRIEITSTAGAALFIVADGDALFNDRLPSLGTKIFYFRHSARLQAGALPCMGILIDGKPYRAAGTDLVLTVISDK
jgi:hypothetical protein